MSATRAIEYCEDIHFQIISSTRFHFEASSLIKYNINHIYADSICAIIHDNLSKFEFEIQFLHIFYVSNCNITYIIDTYKIYSKI